MQQLYKSAVLETPLGTVKAIASDAGLHFLGFTDCLPPVNQYPEFEEDDRFSVFQVLEKELAQWFSGEIQSFRCPLAPAGTSFQQAVWHSLTEIPYGETRTYQKQAIQLGNPSAIRAVAAANGKNPVMILIPCHRIIGTNGKLTGYAGGLLRKQELLALEQKHLGNRLF